MSNTHISVDVFDYDRKHICNLYDSSIQAEGQPYDIIYRQDQNGTKELTFNLPFVFHDSKKRNFRWNYIRSEYQVRISVGNYKDWFIIHSPKRTKNGKGITNEVKCSHISDQLKTKNLYLTFDDTNGIGTIEYLTKRILRNTGWSLGVCDTFLEADGITEKIRSLKSDGKQGAYKLITDACNLFNAYPVFEGESNTVNIYSANNHPSPMAEMTMEKDIESLSVAYNSEDQITRLYVEGEYGDYGYVGIDHVNPTHLPYIMNFEYYKRIGLFTEKHQTALDTYYEKIQPAVETINSITSSILTKESQISTMWGEIDYAIFPVEQGVLLSPILSHDIESEYIEQMRNIAAGDAVIILCLENGTNMYREIYAEDEGNIPTLSTNDMFVLKVNTHTPINGTIGAKQIAVEAKKEMIKSKQKEIDKLSVQDHSDKINKLNDDIAEIQDSIELILHGNEDESMGLYDMMRSAIDLAISIHGLYTEKESAVQIQDNVEADFIIAMGNLLKDGYWNDDNYTVGQEQSLYHDAVDLLERMSKPKVTYTVSMVSLSGILGYKNQVIPLNSLVHLYDNELDINDIVHVSSVTKHLDSPEKDAVEQSNEPISLTSVTMDAILSRMVQLSDLIDQKNSLYSRSEIISSSGSIHANRLEGTINILKNRLSSANSGWYTDNKGNMIFESVNGLSAMMLTGEGFMIASGKDENGDWDWRCFGTGEGFTADAIVTGYLSADRIEAGTISAEKLTGDVGTEIDLSKNGTIQIITSSTNQMNKDIESLNRDMENKVDYEQMTSHVSTVVEQTTNSWGVTINNVNESIKNVGDQIQNIDNSMKTWMRFSEDGQVLGKSNSPLSTTITNEKISFSLNGSEIAYISGNRLYITNARVMERFSIGVKDSGHFDWVMSGKGMSLKWHEASDDD